jgi:hypothetical protein
MRVLASLVHIERQFGVGIESGRSKGPSITARNLSNVASSPMGFLGSKSKRKVFEFLSPGSLDLLK